MHPNDLKVPFTTKLPTSDLFLGLSRICLLQELQGLGYATAVLNLHLVILVLENQVPQSPSSSQAHSRVRTPQQSHENRDTFQLQNL